MSSNTDLPEKFHQQVDAFEAKWRSPDSSAPALNEFLPPGSSAHYTSGLAALVAVDLEYRWRLADQLNDREENQLGARPLVESYIERFPGLVDVDILSELLSLEFQVRCVCGDSPDRESYRSRFPDLFDRVSFPAPRLVSGYTNPINSAAEETVWDTNLQRDFSDYEILVPIAAGGMGVVYKARHRTLNRTVALKMIKSGNLAGNDEIQRFRDEAKAAAQLDHPHIVPIHEVGEHGGRHFFSMAFITGMGLDERLKDGPLPPKEAAELMIKIAFAVQHAHDKGIVHRDLKPSNVLIDTDGQPRITDFGLAKQIATDSKITATGQILGTPSYMPPEQAAGNDELVGMPADVYSLGALLYVTLTGRPPFQAATPLETLQQVLTQEPLSPRRLNSATDRDLETICLKCLEKDASKRYSSARALGEDLQRWTESRPINARPISTIAKGWRWCRRKPLQVGMLVLTALLLMVVGGAAAWVPTGPNGTTICRQRQGGARTSGCCP